MDITKISERDWNEFSHPVHLLSLPLCFRDIEKSLNLKFEFEDNDSSVFCFAKVEGKPFFMEAAIEGPVEQTNVLVSVLSYETEWERIKENILFALSINEQDLFWYQSEMEPSCWKVIVEDKDSLTEESFYFPDELRASNSRRYLMKNPSYVVSQVIDLKSQAS